MVIIIIRSLRCLIFYIYNKEYNDSLVVSDGNFEVKIKYYFFFCNFLNKLK